MRKILQLMIVAILLIVLQTSTLACTIFSADDGIMTLAGNNGDYSDPDTYIVFYPAENGKHGRMYAGWRQFWWQTGMNDQGLFFASASTSFLEVQNSSQKPRPPRYLMYICMEECSTVEDVLEVFDQYNLDFLETMQLMVSDATGASVIIEGDPLHIKQDYYQVVTNFRLSQTDPPYPCWRYNTAIAMFENTTTISPEFFTTICDATHQEGDFPTQFSIVDDLQQQIIYLYEQHNYDQVKIFNLTEELQSGYHIYSIPALFNTPRPPTITGPAKGKVGVVTKYNFTTTDPDGDEVYYFIDWGDTTNSSWIGSYPSGNQITESHTWSKKGTFTIKAKAKDISGNESDWGTLSVTMPCSYEIPFFSFWEMLFERFPHVFPILRYLMGYKISLFFSLIHTKL
jgi:hypothetical protein